MKRFENAVAYALGGMVLLGIVVPFGCQWPVTLATIARKTYFEISIGQRDFMDACFRDLCDQISSSVEIPKTTPAGRLSDDFRKPTDSMICSKGPCSPACATVTQGAGNDPHSETGIV